MPTELEHLSPEEKALMMDAIPFITILVAVADENMDDKEVEAAQRFADMRSVDKKDRLAHYYEAIDDNLEARIRELFAMLPETNEEKDQYLWDKISGLNPILAKLKAPYDYYYYDAFRSLASYIAKASGGFLRFLTVGPQEAEVIDLPMLTPIAKPLDPDDLF